MTGLIPAAIRQVVPKSVREQVVHKGGSGASRLIADVVQLRRWAGGVFRPFDYQHGVIEGLRNRMASEGVSGMVIMPTGAGKTSVAAAAVLQDLRELAEGLVLWIAPQKELLHQAYSAFERVWWSGGGPDSVDLRVVRSCNVEQKPGRHSVVFATPATAFRWLIRCSGTAAITHLLFDEAHHLGATGFAELWNSIRSSTPHLRASIGLSATPARSGDSGFDVLSRALDHKLFYPRSLCPDPFGPLRRRGVLAKIEVERMAGIPPYIAFGGRGGSSSVSASILGSDPEYWMACVDAVRRTVGRTLVYCPTRALGELFAQHLLAVGESAEYVDGSDQIDMRIAALERFRDGQTRVLVNVALLLEGVDCPAAECAVITQPVRSEVRLMQIMGRVMRGPAVGGNACSKVVCADPWVVDFCRRAESGLDYVGLWQNGVPLG